MEKYSPGRRLQIVTSMIQLTVAVMSNCFWKLNPTCQAFSSTDNFFKAWEVPCGKEWIAK